MTTDFTDYFGQPLAVGDRIVYPVGQGSSGVGLAESQIDKIERLTPTDPSDPECRTGYKDSETHKPPLSRKTVELPLRYVLYPQGVQRTVGYQQKIVTVYGRYEYDPTKLFKLRVKHYDSDGNPSKRTSWLKNVDRVIRAPQEAQS